MRLTASMELPDYDGGGEVEVVGTVEDAGEDGLEIHVELIDGARPTGCRLWLEAEAALETEYERLRARGEAA